MNMKEYATDKKRIRLRDYVRCVCRANKLAEIVDPPRSSLPGILGRIVVSRRWNAGKWNDYAVRPKIVSLANNLIGCIYGNRIRKWPQVSDVIIVDQKSVHLTRIQLRSVSDNVFSCIN
jgi:hypothetical protein